MTAAGQHILEDFESLTDIEKREVLSNLLKISKAIEYPETSDDELVDAADAVFLAYDTLEQNG
ncbi:MAG: hypothetical protein QOK37_2970 [Thermoanaerobaculia bacterium]|jgi:hypothetical protein|nr:hypothetical protein [Thermoanaerobaculia bacterium]